MGNQGKGPKLTQPEDLRTSRQTEESEGGHEANLPQLLPSSYPDDHHQSEESGESGEVRGHPHQLKKSRRPLEGQLSQPNKPSAALSSSTRPGGRLNLAKTG